MSNKTKSTATKSEQSDTSRRERVVDWTEFTLETLQSFQKQWNDIVFGYADLAVKAARDGVAWMESFYEQSRKSATALAKTRDERARAALERLG